MTPRTLIEPRAASLVAIAVFSGVFACLWLWLAYAAILTGGLSAWIILPTSLAGATVTACLCLWAVRRRRSDEPAMIIDELGLYDNVSIALAGRIKWRDIEGIWVAGPRWLPILCIHPDDVREYIRKQDDLKALVMRFNRAVLGAPVLIPMSILDLPADEVREMIDRVSGPARGSGIHPGLVTG